MQFHTHTLPIAYNDALHYYKRLHSDGPHFLFESTDTSDKSSRLSLIGFNPILELKGFQSDCEVNCLSERGEPFINYLRNEFSKQCKDHNENQSTIHLPKKEFKGDENERFLRDNIGQVIRKMLLHFKMDEKNFFGFYGALSYNFIYLYEDIPATKENDTPDFHLFLFDNILFFNHLTQQAYIYSIRNNLYEAKANAEQIRTHLLSAEPAEYQQPEIGETLMMPDDETFKKQVQKAKDLCEQGELMELVLCRKLKAEYQGDTLPLYETYRDLNPSPYMFHFDFGDELLLGTSPEVMIRYENKKVVLRPISGSIARGKSVIEDHQNMIELLTDPKEKSELDMLIDLGRNDLSKVCKPGVRIEQYRVIEKYSHVMHTVAQVAGELEDDKIGLDALVAALNAGTLTGAPKMMAMAKIEQMEKHTRGYYGGCIGYFLFNGEVNTGIIIRTSHLKDNELTYCSGATLLYESVPEKELIETNFKAAAFMKILNRFKKGEKVSLEVS